MNRSSSHTFLSNAHKSYQKSSCFLIISVSMCGSNSLCIPAVGSTICTL